MKERMGLALVWPILFFGTVEAQNLPGFEFMVRNLLEEKADTIGSEPLYSGLRSPDLVLLDARSEEEYEVSHLPGAIRIGYDDIQDDVVASLNKTSKLVVYCSVGKRSEEVAAKLESMGFNRVYNLFGGIFDWTNRGFPVVDSTNAEVKRVHPYNAVWGIWINNYDKVDGSE